MAERSIPVRGIAVFEAAARAVSFHAAAEELNLTPSAVSHQIRLLEETLGVKLFERVGRGVTLTAEGAEYARSIRPSLRRLRDATNEIKARAKKGGALEVVRIEIPPSLAHCWLLPPSGRADRTAPPDRHPGERPGISSAGRSTALAHLGRCTRPIYRLSTVTTIFGRTGRRTCSRKTSNRFAHRLFWDATRWTPPTNFFSTP